MAELDELSGSERIRVEAETAVFWVRGIGGETAAAPEALGADSVLRTCNGPDSDAARALDIMSALSHA
jgi:hypothetical protein